MEFAVRDLEDFEHVWYESVPRLALGMVRCPVVLVPPLDTRVNLNPYASVHAPTCPKSDRPT